MLGLLLRRACGARRPAVAGGGGCSGNPDSRLTAEQATAPIAAPRPSWPQSASRPNQLLDGGHRRLRRSASAAARGHPGRGQQVGVVVRALPLRVPLTSSPWRHEARRQIAFLGVDCERLRATPPRPSSRSCRCPIPPTSTPTAHRPGPGRPAAGLPDHRLLRPSGELVFTHSRASRPATRPTSGRRHGKHTRYAVGRIIGAWTRLVIALHRRLRSSCCIAEAAAPTGGRAGAARGRGAGRPPA